ncbi:MAG: hypothetical protein K0R24_1848 [Gammaproteobacteria bacterium]|jgi:hypothetical protein|nr:hypothetical protein [Gammaproteobacteria bacterium]
MITYNTLSNIINHHKELLSTAERYGYTDLRFFSSGNEEEGVLSILAKYTQVEPEFLFEDVNEALAKFLGTKVSLISEGCREADSAFLRQEAEKAPMLDMEKTINYFFDSILPIATGEEPNENQRKKMQEQWKSSRTHTDSLEVKSDQFGAVKGEGKSESMVTSHEETRRVTKHPRDVDVDLEINPSPAKKQTPPRSPQSPPMRPSNPFSFLGDREKSVDPYPFPAASSSVSGALSSRAIELCHALSEELGGDQEQLEKAIEELKKQNLGQRNSGITASGQ